VASCRDLGEVLGFVTGILWTPARSLGDARVVDALDTIDPVGAWKGETP
jgi:hypothetical protein